MTNLNVTEPYNVSICANVTEPYRIAISAGIPGPAGPAGPQGPQGVPGAVDGTFEGTAWWYGQGAPTTVVGSKAGDFYLDSDTGLVYELQ